MNQELYQKILSYVPYNEQEEKDKTLFLDALKEQKDVFTRNNRFAHFTASAWVVDKEREKILLCYHNIYHSWTWLGGHADGEENLLSVAMKEVREESGLIHIRPLQDGNILSLESLSVDGHEKRGEYVSTHLHLNVTYLLEADRKERMRIKEDENSKLGWFAFDDILTLSSEKWFVEHIYPKLNAKLRNYIEKEKQMSKNFI